MLTLPVSEPTATSWRLHDYRDDVITSGPADAFLQTATAIADPVDPLELWLVDHIVVSNTTPNRTILRLYDNQRASEADLLDGADSGLFGVGSWTQGLQIQPMRQLVAVWSGVSAGHRGTIRLQYRVLRKA